MNLVSFILLFAGLFPVWGFFFSASSLRKKEKGEPKIREISVLAISVISVVVLNVVRNQYLSNGAIFSDCDKCRYAVYLVWALVMYLGIALKYWLDRRGD